MNRKTIITNTPAFKSNAFSHGCAYRIRITSDAIFKDSIYLSSRYNTGCVKSSENDIKMMMVDGIDGIFIGLRENNTVAVFATYSFVKNDETVDAFHPDVIEIRSSDYLHNVMGEFFIFIDKLEVKLDGDQTDE